MISAGKKTEYLQKQLAGASVAELGEDHSCNMESQTGKLFYGQALALCIPIASNLVLRIL